MKPQQLIEELNKKISEEIEKANRGEYTTVDYTGLIRILDRLNSNPRFIIELIQNADDNEYDDPEPWVKLHLVPYSYGDYNFCLWLQNNERGFKEENVRALCRLFGSTKRKIGFIGEFGIGFNSVFSITSEPYIYSNGFSFKFQYDRKEALTIIKPIWVENIPSFINRKYTNIILPLTYESKEKVSKELDNLHPYILLFLKNIKLLEIKKNNEMKSFRKVKKGSNILILTSDHHKSGEKMWRIIRRDIPIPEDLKREMKEKVRKEICIESTELVLAFPLDKEEFPNPSEEQFVFAFLPVRKYGFKFIIQGDFLLTSNREDIIKDNKWNEWLRDSVSDVFLDAVNEFKKDEKLKYGFYDYIPLEDDIKDEFFLLLVEQIHERLKEEECILTETNKWRKPSEVLIGDEEIRKIVTNEDLQKFFGKEYLSEKIKAKKSILRKLGVKEFSVDDLIICLKNVEWVKKQGAEWFASLFEYLSKKKLSKEQLEQLKNLKIIKLENGELTSTNEGIVFFPLEKKGIYGFESELRVIKKDIIDVISKYEKEERENILEFLKKLGLKQADPYEIIENHILPVYENGEWRQKDSKVLIGYIRYIKDNVDKYEKESDKRLNTKEDPLKRLKKSLLIRIDRDSEVYDHPENIYLPEIYGNENNLEELFEGINVSFVHPCYLREDPEIEEIDREINELENKLKGKSKRWRKKHRKEVKRIEERLNKLKERRNEKIDEKIEEWKEFFLKIGIWEMIIVKKDPNTEIYQGSDYANNKVTRKHIYHWDKEKSIWKNEKWEETYWESGYYIGDDWISPHLEALLNKINKERYENAKATSEQLLNLLERYWEDLYKDKIQAKYYYRYYGQQGWYADSTKSTFYLILLKNAWLPTTQNTLAKPLEVFLDKPEIHKVLGDTVPYLAVKIENEDFIKTLGINTQANVEGVLNYLKSLVEQKSQDKEKFEKLYKFLDEHFEEDGVKIKEEFAKNSLIFVPNTEKKYYRTNEVIWKDMSEIFGENRIYLERVYPELEEFFVKKLGISEKPPPKDYANVLCSISEKTEISDEDREVIMKIYEELNRNLNPNVVENPISEEDWWEDFIKKRIFLTDKGEFWSNHGDIFINDDNELYELFKDEYDIRFLWLREGYNPDKIKFFIKACNLHYLSENIEPLVEEAEYPENEELTKRIRSVIPYVLRYLYWKENETYEEIKKEIEKIATIKVYAVDNLKVKYSVKVNERTIVSKEAERKCIYYNNKLYIKKNEGSIYDLAVEFSKAFGDVKGLDDFIMNITNNLSNAESIMRAKGIGELPDDDKKILEKIKKREKIESRKKGEATNEKRKKQGELEKTAPEEELPKGGISQKGTGETIGNQEEKGPWEPEVPAEKASINIEEYLESEKMESKDEPKGYKKSAGDKHESPSTTPSKEDREEIGREGEKYALYCIIKEKLEEYFDAKIGDKPFEDILECYANIVKETDKGFKLEKGENVIVEVIWENKKCESGKPYDIRIIEKEKEIFVEVKATLSTTKGQFELSEKEWAFMQENEDRYWIYRVYNVGKNPKVIKIQNPMKLIQEGKLKVKHATIELLYPEHP